MGWAHPLFERIMNEALLRYATFILYFNRY